MAVRYQYLSYSTNIISPQKFIAIGTERRLLEKSCNELVTQRFMNFEVFYCTTPLSDTRATFTKQCHGI
jgi:hypothetical protein